MRFSLSPSTHAGHAALPGAAVPRTIPLRRSATRFRSLGLLPSPAHLSRRSHCALAVSRLTVGDDYGSAVAHAPVTRHVRLPRRVMHRRRLPAGVPLPARAGVAWSGIPRTCRAVGFCAAVRSERVAWAAAITGRRGCGIRPLVRVRRAPGAGARGPRGRLSSGRRTGSQSRAAARAVPTALLGFPYRPFAGLVPRAGVPDVSASRDARRLLASRVRRFRPRRAHVPLALRSTPGGLARGTGRPVLGEPLAGGDPNDPPANGRRDHGGSARLLGFAPAHDPRPSTFVFFAGRDPALGFLGPLSGVRANQTCSTRSHSADVRRGASTLARIIGPIPTLRARCP